MNIVSMTRNGVLHKHALEKDEPSIWYKDTYAVPVELDNNGWYITPYYLSDADKFERIGPFPTPEAAYLALKMIAD